MASKRVRVVNKLPEFIEQRQRLAVQAINEALVLGASEAAGITPHHTGNLINSQYRNVRQEGSRIVGTVGYSAEYALAVHEASGKLKGQPRPLEQGKPQGNFWDPGGEPNFLRQGFANAEPNIRATIAKRLKSRGR